MDRGHALPHRPRGARRALRAAAVAALAMLALPAHGLADTTPALDRVVARTAADRPIRVIVVLRDQVDPDEHARPAAMRADLRATAARTQGRVIAAVGAPAERFWLVNALALRATAGEIDALAARADVASVGLDAAIATTPAASAAAATPGPVTRPWGLDASGAPQAWRMGLNGAGVRIGSIDTGVDAAHPELAGKIVAWRDFVAGAAAPYDDNGHGTHTVGTMVGARPGGVPTGVAPGAAVLVAKAMDGAGRGDASDILAAAQWMTDPDGDPATADQPHVVNNSWGMAVSDPWFRAMVQHWIALGIVPVFSAGNTGPGPGTVASPADYPETLAVGAVSEDGRVAPFSSRGPVTWVDHDAAGPRPPVLVPKPDLAAPGVDVVSSVPGGYATYSGTSMAAPHVSGAVALVRQAAPGLSPEAVMDVMRRSAADRGPAGPDPDYGSGVLDIPAALILAGAAPAPAAPPAVRAPSVAAPAARAARRTPTLAQMRRARRIAVVADRRVRRLEARLTPRRAPRRVAHSTRPVRLRASDMLRTRTIALGAIRRADVLRARLAGRPAPRRTALASRARVRLTPADMRVTTRLARTALSRATRLQAHPRLRA